MMKYFIVCLLAVSCRGVPLSEGQDEDDASAAAFIKFHHFEQEMLPEGLCDNSHVKTTFKLYTKENPNGNEIDPDNDQTLRESSFNVKQDSKIIIHEWLQNETYSYVKDFVAAFLRYKKESVNVFTVDYGSVSRCHFKQVLSMQAIIGQQVGRLMKSLIDYGSVPSKFHLIGLGMGAQIAGISAREIYPKKTGRLTALDPTFLGYMNDKPQLTSTDSEYMDVIHTAQRKFDSVKNLGKARFFPNDGTRQPIGNGKNPTEASVLSHIAAAFYYVQSIVNPGYMKGKLCPDYLSYTLNRCPNPVENNMGEGVDMTLEKGNFYLQVTSSVPPFSNQEFVVKEIEMEMVEKFTVITPRGVVEIDVTTYPKIKAEYEKTINEKTYNEDEIKQLIYQYAQSKPRIVS